MLRDISREPLFSQVADHSVESLLRIAVHDILRSLRLALIHAHIQGRVHPVGEAPLRRVQLVRGDAQIQDNPIHLLDAKLLEHLAHIAVIAADNRHAVPEFLQALSRRLNGVRVLVDADKASLFRKPPADLIGMSASAQSPVHIDPVRPDMQLFNGLVQQNGYM